LPNYERINTLTHKLQFNNPTGYFPKRSWRHRRTSVWRISAFSRSLQVHHPPTGRQFKMTPNCWMVNFQTPRKGADSPYTCPPMSPQAFREISRWIVKLQFVQQSVDSPVLRQMFDKFWSSGSIDMGRPNPKHPTEIRAGPPPQQLVITMTTKS